MIAQMYIERLLWMAEEELIWADDQGRSPRAWVDPDQTTFEDIKDGFGQIIRNPEGIDVTLARTFEGIRITMRAQFPDASKAVPIFLEVKSPQKHHKTFTYQLANPELMGIRHRLQTLHRRIAQACDVSRFDLKPTSSLPIVTMTSEEESLVTTNE